jgi:hypothetical protein
LKQHHAKKILIATLLAMPTIFIPKIWAYFNSIYATLPPARSTLGKQLLNEYNLISHGVFFALLTIVVAGLLWKASQHPQKPKNLVDQDSARNQQHFSKALIIILFLSYTIAMVYQTNWFYPELPDLYQDIFNSDLTNNFTLQERFIAETMKRNSFRFFPLAHQDLHILSWFTPYVKVWMLFSAAELFTSTILVARVVQEMANSKKTSTLLLIISLLFLFHPATGWGFFQLIYCERLLTFLFACFIYFYWKYQQTNSQRLAIFAFITSLLGIFVKDIAIILFVIPALLRITVEPSCRRWRTLEASLIALIPIVIVTYIFLSLIPSLYAQTSVFSSNNRWLLEADWRFYVLIGFCSMRFGAVLLRNSKLVLLDGLNLAALLYAFALLVSVGYPFDSFWTLPVQLVTVMNIGYIWCRWVLPRLSNHWPTVRVSLIGVITSISLITIEHTNSRNFSQRVANIKSIQVGWHSTYLAMEAQIETTKNRGRPINVIFMRSYFNRHTLKQLKADRLIEYHRKHKTYTIVSGINKGHPYIPKTGDFLLTIDKRELKDLGEDADQYNPIYVYKNNRRAARIFRHN